VVIKIKNEIILTFKMKAKQAAPTGAKPTN
jgi:hypothetical protein